jgi:hypothetical protein
MKSSYHFQIGKGNTIHFHTPFRLSKEGYFHFLALGLSIGKEGFSFAFLGFSIGLGWKEY